MLPDLSTAQVVAPELPDLSSAIPVEEDLAAKARQTLAEYTEGKIDLELDQVKELEKVASAGVGPWGRFIKGAAGLGDFPAVGAAIVDASLSGAKHIIGAANKLGDAAKEPTQHQDVVPTVATGVLSGTASLIPSTVNLAAGIGNLIDPREDRVHETNALARAVQRQTNVGVADIKKTAEELSGQKVDTESSLYKVAEFAPQALVPIGVEQKLASTTAKVADAIIEKGTRATGSALQKTASVGKKVAPAAAAVTEIAMGAPWWAPLTTLLAGYGGGSWLQRMRHAIIDKQFDKIGEVGKVLASAQDGRTIIESTRDVFGAEIARLRAQVDDIAKSNPDKIADAYKKGPNGAPLYQSDELSGAAKKVREAEERIESLTQRDEAWGRYANLNQILSDGAKFGLRTGLNISTAGVTGAALTAPSAPYGEEAEAAQKGFGMGASFGMLGAYGASQRQKLGLVREKLLKGQTLDEAHPLYSQHKANMDAMPEVARDYVNSFSALAKKQGGKPIVVLTPEELVAAAKSEGINVDQAPNGFEGRDVIYANRDRLASGVVPHEFMHGTKLDSHPEVVKAIQEMKAIPELADQLQKGIDNYNRDLEATAPEANKLSIDSSDKEIAAALGADMLTSLPPEAIYGGRSGGQIISKWFKDTFGSEKGGVTTQYNFPVSPKMKSAIENALFEYGKGAEQVKPEAAPAPKVEMSDDVKTAAQALEKLGHPAKKAAEMAESAFKDIKTGTVEEIVRKALEKQRPVPIEADLGKGLDGVKMMPVRSDAIDRPASKISDLIFPGTPRQAKVAAKKFGLDDVTIKSTHQPGFVDERGRWMNPEEARSQGEETGQLPESLKDELTAEDLANERRFMPRDDPRAISESAIRYADGRVFSGLSHGDAERSATERYGDKIPSEYVDGFISNSGEFLDRKQAYARAIELRQMSPTDFSKAQREFTGNKDKALEFEAFQDARQFMPSSHPEAIDAPAMRRKSDGKIFAAKKSQVHWMMPDEIPELRDRYTMGGYDRYDDGWTDKNGNFLTKKEAHARATEIGQIEQGFKTEYREALSSLDLREGARFMPSTVNIGLDVKGGERMKPDRVLAELGKYVDVTKHSVRQSGTEPTVIADLSRPLTPEEANKVSAALSQEAIAQFADGKGELYGPQAENWKPFNPDFFLTQDGKKMSEVPNRPQTVDLNTESDSVDTPSARPNLSGVSLQRMPEINANKRLNEDVGPNVDSPAWVHEYFALDKKAKLSPQEETRLDELHQQAEKEYGSYDEFWRAHGGKQYKAEDLFRFMPSSDPRAIKEPAIRYSDGETYTDKLTHSGALMKAMRDGRDHAGTNAPETGFVTNDGEFLGRESARNRATSLKQINDTVVSNASAEGRLEATDFDLMRKFMPASPKEFSELADKYKLSYNGPMESLHVFTDSSTRSTIAIKKDASPDQFEKKILESKAKFAGGEDAIAMMPANPFEQIGKDMGPYMRREEIGWQFPVAGAVGRFVDNLPFFKKFTKEVAFNELKPEDPPLVYKAKSYLRQAIFNKVMGSDPAPWLEKLQEFTDFTSSHFDVVWDDFSNKNASLKEFIHKGKEGVFDDAFKVEDRPDPEETATRQFFEDKGMSFMPADRWSGLDKHLTPEERSSVRERDIPKIVKSFKEIEKYAEGSKAALAGQDQRSWYKNSAEAIVNTFGPDADRFAALLASLSPQVSVETNLQNAVSVYRNWLEAGRPTDKNNILKIMGDSVIGDKGEQSVLGAWLNNAVRALAAEDAASVTLSGPKVNSFMLNLRGNVTEVTNDTWMARYAGLPAVHGRSFGKKHKGDIEVKAPQYLALNAHIRRVADQLTKETGENWSPSEAQAALWSYQRGKELGENIADVPVFDKLLEKMTEKSLANLEPLNEHPFMPTEITNSTWGGKYDTTEDARIFARDLANRYDTQILMIRQSPASEIEARSLRDGGHFVFATPEARERVKGFVVEKVEPR